MVGKRISILVKQLKDIIHFKFNKIAVYNIKTVEPDHILISLKLISTCYFLQTRDETIKNFIKCNNTRFAIETAMDNGFYFVSPFHKFSLFRGFSFFGESLKVFERLSSMSFLIDWLGFTYVEITIKDTHV